MGTMAKGYTQVSERLMSQLIRTLTAQTHQMAALTKSNERLADAVAALIDSEGEADELEQPGQYLNGSPNH